ncbi:hypothetical protein [Diaphorobacter sp.]|uniref:hypothetical protein n=1 Tax=Diaphorobacter sp. TaxID=1934310 RepID=UPI0028A62F96|nr:hypothetical protein [Diaphorobacter sp.]
MKSTGIIDVAIVELQDGSRATLTCESIHQSEQLRANSRHIHCTSDGKIIDTETGAELTVVGYLGTWRPSDVPAAR